MPSLNRKGVQYRVYGIRCGPLPLQEPLELSEIQRNIQAVQMMEKETNTTARPVLLTTEKGETIVIYTPSLTPEECASWARAALRVEVIDSVAIRPEELQYYCIDARVWNTAAEDRAARSYIARYAAK